MLLGVDYGRKRTGLAKGDPATRTAVPLATITFRGLDDLAKRIADRCAECEITTIVLGLPTHPDGEPMRIAEEVESLAERLRARGFEVVLRDEALTTWEAQGLAAESGGKSPVDALAASLILRDYMESLPR